MKQTTDFLVLKPTAVDRWRWMLWICSALVVVILFSMAFYIRRQVDRANWAEASGHMAHMALTLACYEEEYGTLPPLIVRGKNGEPIHSWRGVVLQYVRNPNVTYVGKSDFEVQEPREPIDFSESWDSKGNQTIFAGCIFYMSRFGADSSKVPLRTKLLAYTGESSIWTKEGIPKGRTKDYPDSIWFIWVEKSDLHPMQPGDITDNEIRKRLQQGEDVLYGAAFGSPRKYGRVVLKEGDLVFLPYSELWK